MRASDQLYGSVSVREWRRDEFRLKRVLGCVIIYAVPFMGALYHPFKKKLKDVAAGVFAAPTVAFFLGIISNSAGGLK